MQPHVHILHLFGLGFWDFRAVVLWGVFNDFSLLGFLLEFVQALGDEGGRLGDARDLRSQVDLFGVEVEWISVNLSVNVAAEGVFYCSCVDNVLRFQVREQGPGVNGTVGDPVIEFIYAGSACLHALHWRFTASFTFFAAAERAFHYIIILHRTPYFAPKPQLRRLGLLRQLLNRLDKQHQLILSKGHARPLPDFRLPYNIGHIANWRHRLLDFLALLVELDLRFLEQRLRLLDHLLSGLGAGGVGGLRVGFDDTGLKELILVDLLAFAGRVLLDQVANLLEVINALVRAVLDYVAHDLADVDVEVPVRGLTQMLLQRLLLGNV